MNKQTEALKMVTDILDDELWFPNKYPDEAIPVCFIEALKACKEALEQDDRIYTNTNHGFTLKDRHFYIEGDGGIWDENFDYDASLAVYGDFEDDEQKKQYAQMICDALNAQREALEQQEVSDAELISYRQGYEQGRFDYEMDAELKRSEYKFDHPDYGELTQIPEQPAQEHVAWMEEYQSCKVNGDERLCHSDKVFRLVQLLANQLSDCQSLCAKYAEKTVINGEQKIKEVRAIKEALEQPAQEYLTRAQQVIRANNSAQEPVAVVYSMQDGYVGQMVVKDIPHKTKLYTHPCVLTHSAPSCTTTKEWVGLSDDDMSIIFDKFDWKEVEIAGEHLDLFAFARAIEQALKEKNAIS